MQMIFFSASTKFIHFPLKIFGHLLCFVFQDGNWQQRQPFTFKIYKCDACYFRVRILIKTHRKELYSDENMKIIHLKSDRKDKRCINLTEHWRHEREREGFSVKQAIKHNFYF